MYESFEIYGKFAWAGDRWVLNACRDSEQECVEVSLDTRRTLEELRDALTFESEMTEEEKKNVL